MAMRDLNILELYFFGPAARKVLKTHQDALHAALTAACGETWMEQVDALVTDFVKAVDISIKEQAEAAQAITDAGVHMEKIGPWRRLMESVANAAPPANDRRELLKVAGYGLGQVRTVKEAKDFMVKVKPLVALKAEDLKKRGVKQAALDFPEKTLKGLVDASDSVAKEKAEATLAMSHVAKKRGPLMKLMAAADDAINMVEAQAAFLAEAPAEDAAETVATTWLANLNEARVLSQKRAAKGDVPLALVDTGKEGTGDMEPSV